MSPAVKQAETYSQRCIGLDNSGTTIVAHVPPWQSLSLAVQSLASSFLQEVPVRVSQGGTEMCKAVIRVVPVAGTAEQWAWKPLPIRYLHRDDQMQPST